jgi:uncharacterized protein YqgQ
MRGVVRKAKGGRKGKTVSFIFFIGRRLDADGMMDAEILELFHAGDLSVGLFLFHDYSIV